MSKGIIQLIEKYKASEISSDDYKKGLDSLISLSQRKKEKLKKAPIIPGDKKLWDEFILPGLNASFDILMAAAEEAKDYAISKNEQRLVNVVALFGQIDKAIQILESKLKGASTNLQNIVSDSLTEINKDVSQVGKYAASDIDATMSLDI